MSTLGSDKKSKNDKDTLSSNDMQTNHGPAGISNRNEIEKMKLRFNSDKSEIGGFSRRADYSVDSSSVLNNRSLREADSHLRGSHKDLMQTGKLLRESGGIDSIINDLSLKKKNTRINGV